MEILIQAGQFLLSLSLIVILHEFGHYLPAKAFGTRVEKFYLFFDYKYSLFKKKIGETEWGIGWIPLGGYVKISGMVDESMDLEQLDQPAQDWEFRSKPAWQRLIIMVGGVTVNLILGFLIYAMMLWYYGEQILPTDELVDGVWVVSPLAEEIGFESGDRISSVNGEEVYDFGSLTEEIIYGGEVLVERDGATRTIEVPTDVAGQMSEAENRGSFFYPRVPFIVSGFVEDSPNKEVFQIKDRIIAVDGEPLPYYDMASDRLLQYAGQSVNVTVEREGQRTQVQAQVNEEGKIGIATHILKLEEMAKMELYDFDTREYGFAESFPAGWAKTMDKLGGYVRQFSLIFDPSTGAHKGLGGFISIGKLFPPTWDWQVFWSITALLSIILAVMNLLPIPVLDGGHVVFLLWEMATGRQPNQKVLEYAQLVGFIMLIALLLYANGLDVIREFFQ